MGSNDNPLPRWTLLRQGAQGSVIHNDDTTAKILEFMSATHEPPNPARRNFVDIAELFPEQCRMVLQTLQQVYHHDAIAKREEMSDEQRIAFHRKKSAPLMAELHASLTRMIEGKLVEPNSALGGAISYMLKHWKPLTLFLEVPAAPIDNNVCELLLKRAIMHRKNSLFFKTQRGAEVGDLYMSLIHTCFLNSVDPFDYLTTLEKHHAELDTNPERWMPWNYRENIGDGV